jgi:hypothetical protein
LAAQQARDRKLERDVIRRARGQEQHDVELLRWRESERAIVSRTAYEEWVHTPRGFLSTEEWSQSDRLADLAVASGGGVEEIIAATRLDSRENVYRLIKPAIVARALANERRRRRPQKAGSPRLRRLKPDGELIKRRAAGEPLRRLAEDYAVSHTTLSRYFAHPRIEEELHTQRRLIRDRRQREDRLVWEWTAKVTTQVRATVCPRHHRRPRIRSQWNQPAGYLPVECCCAEGARELQRRLEINGIESAWSPSVSAPTPYTD